jgi:SAM-dependent methyltransferase
MVALAQQAHPGMEFQVAEVVALPFPDGSFNAVICNSGVSHFPQPEAALAECVRVLVPGGTLAFSWWDLPERQRVQGLFREAIAELRLVPPPEVPQGHDILRFADPNAFAGLLWGAGLAEVSVSAHGTNHLMPNVEALWQAGIGGMAVTSAAVAAQDAATQDRAREVIARLAEDYRGPRGLEFPIAYSSVQDIERLHKMLRSRDLLPISIR